MNQCEKMELLLSSLLLASLCALSSWSVTTGTLVVTQSPDVTVMEGEAVSITCCWIADGRVSVKWLKNHTEIKRELNNNGNKSGGFLKDETKNCSTLTFPNISRDDAGRYICQVAVEIPRLSQGRGNGTVITVLSKEDREDNKAGGSLSSSFTVIIPLVVVVPLLFVTLICFCTLRRKRAQAARVIYEVPHTDSEVPEMDKHSTSSSRGSSQWCQVPVYESFYFEHVETKESG